MNPISRTLRTSLAVAGLAALAVAVSPSPAQAAGNVPGWFSFMGPQDQGCLTLAFSTATNTCSRTLSVQFPFEQQNNNPIYSDATVAGGGSGQEVQCAFYSMPQNGSSTSFNRTQYVATSIPFRTQTLTMGNESVLPAGSLFVHCLMDPGTSISNVRAFNPG